MTKLLIATLGAIFLLAACSSPRERTNVNLIKSDDGSRFATQRTEDLRIIFRSEEDIGDLKRQKLCSVMMIAKFTHSIQNIPVGDGLTLDKIMLRRFGQEYDGQIKVVSKNSIIQTSIDVYNPGEQTNILVHPGDLVFINGRE
jgi:hypothetical protein